MGKIVVSEFVSLDGVVEAPGGGEEFVHAGWTSRFDRGSDGDAFKIDETRNTDALLFGRVTYEGMAAAWPGREGEFADRFNSLPKFVVSSTMSDASWHRTTILPGDLCSEVARLKARFEGDIVVHGSASLVQSLVRLDLVDEIRLMVFPIVLGQGKRLFGDTADAKRLRLVDSREVGEGITILTYAPVFDFLVSREMPADLDATWLAWTQPEQYGEWFNARPGTVRLDVRPGGAWSLELDTGREGEVEQLSGSYVDVVPRERLLMTTNFGDDTTEMEMTFHPTGPLSTRVDIRQVSDTVPARDGARAGSEILLGQCAAYLGTTRVGALS